MSHCPFCYQLSKSDGSIYHGPDCEGMRDAELSKLQVHALRAGYDGRIEGYQSVIKELSQVNAALKAELAETKYEREVDGWAEVSRIRAELKACQEASQAAQAQIAGYRAALDTAVMLAIEIKEALLGEYSTIDERCDRIAALAEKPLAADEGQA